MSRQNGESIKQYVSRRRRSWTLLTQMDPVIDLSEGHRSDMLLDLSGLTLEERVMVQASISNECDFDRVAKLSSSNFRVYISGRTKDERRATAKKDSNVLTIQTLAGFAGKANTLAVKILERVPITRTSSPLKITIISLMKIWMNVQTPIKPTMTQSIPEAMTEKRPQTTMTTRKMTRFLRMLLWTMLLFSRQPNWTQLHYWPTRGTMTLCTSGASERTSECTSLPLLRKGQRAKPKGKGKGRYLVRPSHLSLEDRRRRLKELKAKTEC